MKCYQTLFKISKSYTKKAANNLNIEMLKRLLEISCRES